jgi:hypothetical protein
MCSVPVNGSMLSEQTLPTLMPKGCIVSGTKQKLQYAPKHLMPGLVTFTIKHHAGRCVFSPGGAIYP